MPERRNKELIESSDAAIVENNCHFSISNAKDATN